MDHLVRITGAEEEDAVLAEYGGEHRIAVATSDPHLLDLCHDEGIAVHPLPDSQGRRWTVDYTKLA